MSLLYPRQRDKNSSKWKHKQRILVVIFPGYYSGSYLSHTNSCCSEETLSCKVYTFQFTSAVCILHAFPWRSLRCSLTRNVFCCKINLKASISPFTGNHLTNASTKPPHTSIPVYRCINSLESLLGEISSLTERSAAFSFPDAWSWRVWISRKPDVRQCIPDEWVDKSLP